LGAFSDAAPRVRPILPLLLTALSACHGAAPEASAAIAQRRDAISPLLSPTRQLRRLHLTLRGREPDEAGYRAVQQAAASNTLDTFFAQQIDAAFVSSDFVTQMELLGHDYLRVGDYKRGSAEGGYSARFKGNMSPRLDPCAAGTLHAGALGHFSDDTRQGDPRTICTSATATVTAIEPWWAPGTMVQVIGNAGSGVITMGGTDCGRSNLGDTEPHPPHGSCSCGPNLTWCRPRAMYGGSYCPNNECYEVDAANWLAASQRRMLYQEPAKLFSYVVTQDQSFADLVTGSYTVAPRHLRHLYVRWGRINSNNAARLDASTWWRSATDTWDRVELESLHPNLLSDRAYRFDPRTDDGAPRGIPAAGVLTQLGPSVWYLRERVRAARFLEIFACRNFTAPDPSLVFTPPYTDDPYRQGTCQHCHTTLDPAAIHFKRLEVEDDTPRSGVGHANLGGVGTWQWRQTTAPSFADPGSPGGVFWYQPYGRWAVNFRPGTFLTPVTPARVMMNADARFLDFLPAGERLFGLESDGTVGPLGFGKLLVASGEFDRCAVHKLFETFMGRPLDVSREGPLEAELVQSFVSGDRRVKPWVKALLQTDEFRRGL